MAQQSYLQQNALKIFIGVILVIVVLVFLQGLLGPVFKLLHGMFDGLDSITSSFQSLMQSCRQKGFFSRQCGVGIFAAVAGGLYLLMLGVRGVLSWRSKNQSKLAEQAEFMSQRDSLDIANEMLEKVTSREGELRDSLRERLGREPTTAEVELAQRQMLKNEMHSYTNELVERMQFSPQEVAQRRAALQEYAEELKEENNREAEESGVEEEGQEAAEDAADHLSPVE